MKDSSTAFESPAQPLPSLKTMVWRGLKKKCPNCGEGPVFVRWLEVRDTCPKCGVKYLEDQGDLMGMMILLDRVIFLVPLVTIFCFLFPHSSPWVYIPVTLVALFLLIITLPNRNAANLALDFYIRQKRAEDQKVPGQP